MHQVALDIRGVTVDGAEVDGWRTGRNTLDIPMPDTGDAHEVAISYAAAPRTGLHFRGGKGTSDPGFEVWSQGEAVDNRYWFPGWDYPNDKFTVAIDLTVSEDYLAFANGPLQGTEDAGEGWKKWSYRLDRPIVNYLVAIAAGDYALYTEDGEVPLEYVTSSKVDERGAQLTMGYAKPQLVYFNDLLGTDYPYPIYRQLLVSRFLYGGMENAGMTILADTMLVRSDLDRSGRAEGVVAHELAHQWFGDLLTCYGWRELWLNEGFATFYTGRWMEQQYGAQRYASKVDGWMHGALHAKAPMAARSWSKVNGRDNAAVYVRGASVLHMLRVHLGDEVFDTGIQKYVADNADRLVESSDLRRALEEVSGTHLGWLFDQWVYGVGAPDVKTSWRWNEGELVVTLKQTTKATAFSAPVQIEIGPDILRTLWLGDGETRLVLDLDEAPPWVAVDPHGGVLARWEHEQETAAWIAQAQHTPSAHARIVAVEKLREETETPEIRTVLRDIALDTGIDDSLRKTAVYSLGELGSEEAVAAILEATGSDNRRVREAAVDTLGEAVSSREILARLARMASADPDAVVRASAVAASAELDSSRGAALARSALSKRDDSPRRIEHANALRVIGDHGTAADFPLLLRHISADRPRGVQGAASEAAMHRFGEEGEDFQERERSRLAAKLIVALDDIDLRTRQSAVAKLGKVGDDAAEAALLRMASQTQVRRPDMASLARDAASLIRRGQADGDDEGADDEEDLELLNQRLDELQKRLKRLEEWR
jgi:aminopeptidase N